MMMMMMMMNQRSKRPGLIHAANIIPVPHATEIGTSTAEPTSAKRPKEKVENFVIKTEELHII